VARQRKAVDVATDVLYSTAPADTVLIAAYVGREKKANITADNYASYIFIKLTHNA
jgi:hypothetical protein